MTPERRLAMLKTRRDLPEEVKRQLSKYQPQEWMRIQITQVLLKYGSMNVDEIIVGMWAEFKRVCDRRAVQNCVIEMCGAGEVLRVKRGHYRVPKEQV